MGSASEVALLDKYRCGDLVVARFARPDGYAFRAGQWFRLTLETSEGPQVRTFSHASAPADPYIEFATRSSDSAYKRALERMEPGEVGTLAGPGGRLALPTPADLTVFLVGGVGITPVRGLLRDAVQRGIVFEDAVVVYGNRSPDCVAYLEELEAMRPSGVRVIPVYEAPGPGWEGDVGFITEAVLQQRIDRLQDRPFVVAGPPVMVQVMAGVLGGLGVGPERTTIEAFGRIASLA